MQGVRDIHRVAQVLEPDARFLLVLLDVGTTVRRKGERHLIVAPLADGVRSRALGDRGIALALTVEDGGDILVLGLRLDDGDHLLAAEQGVVDWARARRPLGDGDVAPFLRPRARAVAQVLRVRLPADAAQLLVDEQARLGLTLVAVCRRKIRALLALLARQPLCRGRLDGLGRHLFVMGRFFPAFLGRLARLHDLRRHEVAVLVVVVAVRLVEPLRQRVSKR